MLSKEGQIKSQKVNNFNIFANLLFFALLGF